MKKNNRKKAFVLPTVIFSMVMLSLISVLMISAMIGTKLNTEILTSKSNEKLNLERIYFDFKNNNLGSYEGYEVCVYAENETNSENNFETQEENGKSGFSNNEITEYENDTNSSFKALIVLKNDVELLFAICEFNKTTGEFVKLFAYQTNDFLFEYEKIDEENINKDRLSFGSLNFIKEV